MEKPTPITSIPEHQAVIARRRITRNTELSADGCWEWNKALDRYGYGRFRITLEGVVRASGAHRISWLVFRGDISDPVLQIDHLCRNRRCVNPAHLDLVTNYENYLRAAPFPEWRFGVRGSRGGRGRPPIHNREHCAHGHPWIPENIYVRVDRNGYVHKTCKQCNRIRSLAAKVKRRASSA